MYFFDRKVVELSKKLSLSVVADSEECLKGLSKKFQNSLNQLKVLVECDTGAERCGVVSPDAALALSTKITELPGLFFAGLMTYPPTGKWKR